MTRDTIYDRLREIGCSVETADATAEALDGTCDKKVMAFLLWLEGFDQCQSAHIAGIGYRTMKRMLANTRMAL